MTTPTFDTKKAAQRSPKEITIEDWAVDYAENAYRMVSFKAATLSQRGTSDRIFIAASKPRAIFFIVEFKRDKNAPFQPLQERKIDRLKRMGAYVFVVRSKAEARTVIDAMAREASRAG